MTHSPQSSVAQPTIQWKLIVEFILNLTLSGNSAKNLQNLSVPSNPGWRQSVIYCLKGHLQQHTFFSLYRFVEAFDYHLSKRQVEKVKVSFLENSNLTIKRSKMKQSKLLPCLNTRLHEHIIFTMKKQTNTCFNVVFSLE